MVLYAASLPDAEDTDPFTPETILATIAAHSQIIPVANTTARAQLVTALAGKGFTPTTGNPLYVNRTDNANAIEMTTNGTTWRSVAGPRVAAVCSMTQSVPTATLAAENLSIARQTGSFSLGLTSSYSLITPTTGWYTMSVAAFISGSAPEGRAFVELILNDSGAAMVRFPMYSEAAGGGTFQFELTAGDGVKVQVYQSSGTTRTINGSFRMIGQPTPIWA